MESHRIWKLGNDIDTDQIIPSQYLLLPSAEEMKPHTLETLKPDFASQAKPGDVIVANKNFGCGSSREQAPLVLKALGISAVIAASFARIFFRNSINIGLPLIVCGEIQDQAEEKDSLEFSLEKGEIIYKGKEYHFARFPEHIRKIIDHGGLIGYLNASN